MLSVSVVCCLLLVLLLQGGYAREEQFKLWSAHVRNEMPPSIKSKMWTYTSITIPNCSSFACHVDTFVPLQPKVKYAITHAPPPPPAGSALSMDHPTPADPFMFFRLNTLTEGAKIHLRKFEIQMPERHFLPQEIASNLTLSKNSLQKAFPEAFQDDVTRKSIMQALWRCSDHCPKCNCTKSFEDLIGYARNMLSSKKVIVLTTNPSVP